MSTFNDATVLVTGGASGIGKLMGAMAIERGCKRLILWDVRQQALDDVVKEFSARLKEVHGYAVDVSQPEQIRGIAAASEEQSAASEEITRSLEEINTSATETASQ